MKTYSHIITLAALALAVTAQATPLQIDAPATITITGRLMSPSGSWNFTMTRAGVITIKDAGGAVVAEKTWNDFDASNPGTYAAKDSSVSGATVSKPLNFTFNLDAGSYDWGAVGSYSQASSGYLWIDLAVTVTPNAPTESWTHFDELVADWHDTTSWSPDPNTVPSGQSFTQTKEQIQEWRRGERSTTGAERNVENYFLSRTQTQTNTGTKQKTVPVISWEKPAAITYGTPLSGTQLNATANVAGTFSYTPSEGTVLNALAGQPLEVTFTPDDAETYAMTTATQSITVNKATTTLAITSPTSPATLPIDSAAALTTTLRRDHDGMTLSTASVTYEIAATTGTAVAQLSLNSVTMTNGAGNDTVTVRASFGGNANHLGSEATVTFRVPRPGTIEFSATTPLVSPITVSSAFLFSEHGPTTSSFDFQVTNTGELPAEISSASFTAQLGSIPSFTITDTDNKPVNFPTTLAAGQTRNLRLVFRPHRYALNRDQMKLSWRCRPNISTVNNGEVNWTLEGTGLKPIMATIPKDGPPNPTNPHDLAAQWPSLRTH